MDYPASLRYVTLKTMDLTLILLIFYYIPLHASPFPHILRGAKDVVK